MVPEMLLRKSAATVVDRRDFLKVCSLAAAAVGLPSQVAASFAQEAQAGRKPSVIWLHFQECTGCTESLLRASHPDIADVIFDFVSLDYHETLAVAAGHQVEAARRQAMADNAGKYVLVVEGAIPTKDDGVYCMIGGQTAIEMLEETAAQAGAIIAIGSCASWGGIQSADPNPTGAKGAPAVLAGKTVVTIPGCPPHPYNFLGTVLQYATLGTLPALDDKGRPLFAYGRTIHEHCPRRAHFDAGRFAKKFGDEGHRQGWCLYELGCKGPQTFANCSVQDFCDVPDAWPIGLGHPCFGCTEQDLAFNTPMHATIGIPFQTPGSGFAPISAPSGKVGAVATGVAGLVVGGLIGAGVRAAKQMETETPEPRSNP